MTENSTISSYSVSLLFILGVSIGAMILVWLITIIPYIGTFIFKLLPISTSLVYLFVGGEANSRVESKKLPKGKWIIYFLFVVCSLTFATRYIVGYYIYPIKIKQLYKSENKKSISYTDAVKAIEEITHKTVGTNGIMGHALYVEHLELRSRSFFNNCSRQFENTDSIEGFVIAIINVIIYTIPMIIKLILNNIFKLGVESGIIGVVYWYIVSLTFVYWGWKW